MKLETTLPGWEEHVFRCDCHNGFLRIVWDRSELDDGWTGYLVIEHFTAPANARTRIKKAWRLLRRGFVEADEVILHPTIVRSLAAALELGPTFEENA